jgi:hypothetical protein
MLLPLGGKLEDQPVRAAKATRQTRLPYLTEPADLVEADEGAAEDYEGLVDFGAPLVTDCKASEAVQPCQGPLSDPAAARQPFARLHASSCDPGHDGAGATLLAAAATIIGLVGLELLGPPARSTSAVPHAGHGVEGRSQHEGLS